MKLAFKLPKFKLPKFRLPAFGKKKATSEAAASQDDRPDDDGQPAAAGGEDGDVPALAALEESVVGGPADDNEPPNEDLPPARAGGKRRLLIIGGGLGGVLVLAGIGWLVLAGGGPASDNSADGSGIPKFKMNLPPKGRTPLAGSLNAIIKKKKEPGTGVIAAASTVTAYAGIAPPLVTDGPLPEINDPALIEQSRQGPLPKIAKDGRKPWQVYGKTFDDKDSRPKIAIIMTGLGLSRAATQAAITLLPGAVTLAFDPYAQDLPGWAEKARQAGHEIMIEAPLEPASFPLDDPGPQGLMTTNAPEENLLRLEYILSRMSRYVGVISTMGSKFDRQKTFLQAFLGVLKNRGLLFVDGSADRKSLAPAVAKKLTLTRAYADLVLDDRPTGPAIDAKLADLENIVRANAVAVAVADPYPITIRRIAAWAAGLDKKKLVLAPVTAIADRQVSP